MPIPLAAIPAIISAGSALYGAFAPGKGPSAEERRYRGMFDRTMDGLGQRSQGFASRFESDLEGFDPEPMYTAATEARLDEFDENFADEYAGKLGAMVGAGRTPSHSGFGLRSAQDTIRQGQTLRGRIRQQGAENLAGARMNLLGMRGNYAGNLQNTYLDAITGRLNTLEAQRLEDAAGKRGMFGSLLGAGAQAAGAYFGAKG